MATDLVLYILLGFVQVCTAVWGGIVSARSLPSGRERNAHVAAFSIFGIFGTALIVWSGLRSYDAQKLNAETQTKLQNDLGQAREKMDQSLQRQEYIRGQLDSLSVMVEKIGEKSGDPGLKDLAFAISKMAERAAKPIQPTQPTGDKEHKAELKRQAITLASDIREFVKDSRVMDPDSRTDGYLQFQTKIFKRQFLPRLVYFRKQLASVGITNNKFDLAIGYSDAVEFDFEHRADLPLAPVNPMQIEEIAKDLDALAGRIY